MNIFTANQVNQVYVLTGTSTIVGLDSSHDVSKSNYLGTVGVGKTADEKSIYFKHLGAGGVTRSDIINIDSIMSVKATLAKDMAMKLPAAKVTLNTEALSSSKPIVGEDFILRVKFQNPIGMSPDNQYWKYGAVHAADMSASSFYLKMASSLAKNMSRDAVQLIKVYVTYGAGTDKTEITASSDVTDTSTFSQTYTGILIEAQEPDWILGVKQLKPIVFSVEPDVINNGTDEVVWGDVVYSNSQKVTGGVEPTTEIVNSGAPTGGTIVNSKLMADYEYFYMGERGDQYRMVGWPDYVPTTYLVDSSSQYGYDTIGIHYAYTGSNHAMQKSEKDITFIVPRASTDSTASNLGAKTASLLAAINAAIPTYVKAGAAATSGKLAVFDSNGALTASSKEPGDIS